MGGDMKKLKRAKINRSSAKQSIRSRISDFNKKAVDAVFFRMSGVKLSDWILHD
jgi:hypothetical protein